MTCPICSLPCDQTSRVSRTMHRLNTPAIGGRHTPANLRDLAFEARRFRRRILTDPEATPERLLGGTGQFCSHLRDDIRGRKYQQPRQILLILRSTALFSSLISTSPLLCGPVTVVPDPGDLAEPVVTPLPALTPDPDDCAVPALLVPGGVGDARLDAFPAPLGSSPALFTRPERRARRHAGDALRAGTGRAGARRACGAAAAGR